MIASEWIQKVQDNSGKLISLLERFHPQSYSEDPLIFPDLEGLPITARSAESACVLVRKQIASEPHTSSPKDRWTEALASKDIDTMMSLLSGAWFGVPESTSCWSIEGFKEAVELLENPPYEE